MITDPVVVDVSQDWAVACDVQERFMEVPCAGTHALTCSARCRQLRALGGDCFDFLPLPGRRVALAVADASGKGLPAALIIANVQSSRGKPPATLVLIDGPVHNGDGSITWLEAVAPPVGMFADTIYNATEVQLNPADLIVAYTDGIVEAANRAGDEWGVDGLLGAIAACRSPRPDRIVHSALVALDAFSAGGQTDDATILAAIVN